MQKPRGVLLIAPWHGIGRREKVFCRSRAAKRDQSYKRQANHSEPKILGEQVGQYENTHVSGNSYRRDVKYERFSLNYFPELGEGKCKMEVRGFQSLVTAVHQKGTETVPVR